MIITKSGNIEELDCNKIYEKLKKLSQGLSHVDYEDIVTKTVGRIYDGVTTNELDKISEMYASNLVTTHYNYNILAVRLFVSNLHDNTSSSLLKIYDKNSKLYKYGLISDSFSDVITKFYSKFEFYMNYDYDYEYDYQGITTLANGYLLQIPNNNLLNEKHLFYNIQQDFINKKINNEECKNIIKEKLMLNTLFDNKDKLNKYVDIIYNKVISYNNVKNNSKKNSKFKIIERPIQMLLRVAIQVRFNFDLFNKIKLTNEYDSKINESMDKNINEVIETFIALCKKYFIHATPTLFNSGTKTTQLASCFLQYCPDSIEGITKVFSDTAIISKHSGGVGITMGSVRAKGSYIYGTGGHSDGIVPFNKVLNDIGRAFNQGGGKRKGSIAIYIEIFHADIFDFLKGRMESDIDENLRCKDLFMGLWVCDLFMEKLKNDEYWYLMCPNECKELTDVYDEFDRNSDNKSEMFASNAKFTYLYNKYVENGKFIKQIKARDLFTEIIKCQTETGLPYILFKDSCNRKSNQKNLGVIKQSNLCAEIIEYSDDKETAVCNLGNMGLKYIMQYALEYHNIKRQDIIHDLIYNNTEQQNISLNNNSNYKIPNQNKILFNDETYNKIINTFLSVLYENTKIITKNLDNVIDRNFYPTPETKYSNFKNRPIGIGLQGLQDAFIMLGLEFTSNKAKKLNKLISAVMYYASLESSNEIAKEKGYYESYPNSPISKGIIQPHLWKLTTEDIHNITKDVIFDSNMRLDWYKLIDNIKQYGVRNSLLIALAPTATTSHILGSVESFEPITNIMYIKENLAGNFQIFNSHFQKDMDLLGLWNNNIKNKIVLSNGKISNIDEIPKQIRDIYKSVWEIKQTELVQMDADRGIFIDQSHSSNRYIENVTGKKIYTILLSAWEKGLKTGSYYLRSKAPSEAIKFSIDYTTVKNNQTNNQTNNQINNQIDNHINNQTNNHINNQTNNQINNQINNKVDDQAKKSPKEFKRWLEESRKKAESGDCEACQ